MAARKTNNPPKMKITDEVLKTVEALSKYGLTIEQMADFFSVDRATFHRYMEKNATLRATVERGRGTAFAAIGQNLYQMASAKIGTGQFEINPTTGEKKEIMGPDPRFIGAAIFCAKTRMGWKETQVTEHAGSVDVNKQAENMSPEERLERMQELADKLGFKMVPKS